MKIKALSVLTVAILTLALGIAACAAPATTSPATSSPAATATVAASPASTVAATTASPAASASAAAAGQTFTGYLIDQKCGVSGIDILDGTDLTKSPEKHQLSCAKMPGCLASGFGLSVKQSDGTYKYYKFDAAGSKTAIDTIINKTITPDNLLVDVSGTMSGDTITVASITAK